jgi:hypothetical protein
MSDLKDPFAGKRFGDSCVVPLSRKEWEQEHRQALELGIEEPDDTYEDYLKHLARDFGIVCIQHDD